MQEDCAPAEVATLRARLAERIPDVVELYVSALDRTDNPLGEQPRGEVAAAVEPLLRAVSTGDLRVDRAGERVGTVRARQGAHPVASLRAADLLHDVTARFLAAEAEAAGVSPLALTVVLRDLHRALVHRISDATVPYANELLRRVSHAHLDERKRIARDLHDRVLHGLAVVLQHVELRQIAVEHGDQVLATSHLEQVHESLHWVSQLVREISEELGSEVTSSGLVPALELFVERFCGPGSSVVTDDDRTGRMPVWATDELYFATREAIRNAVRHSGTTDVEVRIDYRQDLDEALVSVRDHGNGDVGHPERTSSGKGLTSMRERVDLLGGTVRWDGRPGVGTTVDIRVPLDRHDD